MTLTMNRQLLTKQYRKDFMTCDAKVLVKVFLLPNAAQASGTEILYE